LLICEDQALEKRKNIDCLLRCSCSQQTSGVTKGLGSSTTVFFCQKRWNTIHIVNFVEARGLYFKNFFVAMRRIGIRTSITAVSYVCARWVSRGKVLARLFELRHEINQFVLSQNNHHPF